MNIEASIENTVGASSTSQRPNRDGLIRRLNVTREAKALLTSDVDRDTSIAETRNDRHTLTRPFSGKYWRH